MRGHEFHNKIEEIVKEEVEIAVQDQIVKLA